jgi:uncharacterized membrane protein
MAMRKTFLFCLLFLCSLWRLTDSFQSIRLPLKPFKQPKVSQLQPFLQNRLKKPLERNVVLQSVIQPNDYWSVWSAVALSSFIGLKLEQNTLLGKSLSAPECATLASTLFQTLNVMPAKGSVYISLLQTFIVKYAAPLVLLGADIKEIYPETMTLILSFFVGTLGTVLGSCVSFLLLRNWFKSIGLLGESWKFLGALMAKNIGGGLNFQTVTKVLEIPPDFANLSMAVDNIIGLLYFPLIYYLSKRYSRSHPSFFRQRKRISLLSFFSKTETKPSEQEKQKQPKDNKNLQNQPQQLPEEPRDKHIHINERGAEPMILTPEFPSDSQIDVVDVSSLLSAVSIAFMIVSSSELIAKQLNIHPILISNGLTIFLASTVFSRYYNKTGTIKHIVTSGNILGRVLYLLLYGSWGYFIGNIFHILQSPHLLPFFLCSLLLYGIHLLTIFLVGKYLFRLDVSDLLLGSNANIGNAATASGLARTMKWNRRIIPAIVIGNIGSLIGTRVGLLVAKHILKPFT